MRRLSRAYSHRGIILLISRVVDPKLCQQQRLGVQLVLLLPCLLSASSEVTVEDLHRAKTTTGATLQAFPHHLGCHFVFALEQLRTLQTRSVNFERKGCEQSERCREKKTKKRKVVEASQPVAKVVFSALARGLHPFL